MAKNKNDKPVVEVSLPEGINSFITPIAIILCAILVSGSILYVASKLNSNDTLGVTTDSDTDTTQDTGNDTTADTTADATTEPGTVVRTFETFTEYDLEVCKDGDKPQVFLFSTTWCPHCEWIKETFDNWAAENSDRISAYHWELDTKDNTLTSEVETEIPADFNSIYEKFNPSGTIPTFVFGCRYGRVGNGYESEEDLEKEKATFSAVLEELLKL